MVTNLMLEQKSTHHKIYIESRYDTLNPVGEKWTTNQAVGAGRECTRWRRWTAGGREQKQEKWEYPGHGSVE